MQEVLSSISSMAEIHRDGRASTFSSCTERGINGGVAQGGIEVIEGGFELVEIILF